MRDDRGRRAGRFGALAGTVLALLLAFPTSALAQIDVGQATGGVDETVDEATDTVDKAVDTAERHVDETAGSEGGIVDETTDTFDRGTETTGQAVDDTVDDGTDIVNEAAQGRIGPLDKPIQDAAGRVGGVVDSILGGGNGNGDRRNARDDATLGDTTSSGSNTTGSPGAIDGFAAAGNAGATAGAVTGSAAQRLAQSAPSSLRSPTEQLIENVGEVLSKVAFPIALLVLVGAFLVIQGRVDRSDPKLALAPVDVEQEYLSFR